MEHKQNGFKVISNKAQTVNLCSNPLLEFLTRAHPLHVFYFYTPIILYLCYIGLIKEGIGVFILELFIGLFLWTLIEYFGHRFFFHYQAASDLGKKIFFFVHEAHHAYPRDSFRLVTSPLLSFPFVVLVGFIYHLIFGKYFITLVAGSLLGYVSYEIFHYCLHHFKLNYPVLRRLRQCHLHHHYIESDRGFSVSIIVWDYIFRTQPRKPIKSTAAKIANN